MSHILILVQVIINPVSKSCLLLIQHGVLSTQCSFNKQNVAVLNTFQTFNFSLPCIFSAFLSCCLLVLNVLATSPSVRLWHSCGIIIIISHYIYKVGLWRICTFSNPDLDKNSPSVSPLFFRSWTTSLTLWFGSLIPTWSNMSFTSASGRLFCPERD